MTARAVASPSGTWSDRTTRARTGLSSKREFDQAKRHRRVRIGHRRDRGKMIGAGHFGEAGFDAGAAPGIDDHPALPVVFGTFLAADDGVEVAMRRCRPEQRA